MFFLRLKEMIKRSHFRISLKILEVIYHLGEVVDPLTQKPVVAEKYVDQIEREGQLYGKYPQGLAPNRLSSVSFCKKSLICLLGKSMVPRW